MATRTWVSGVGDDVNPCSRTAPCKTFAGAISKTAAHGEIDSLDPGGFGAVTITKAITIDGGGGGAGFGSILAANTNGVVINAGANDVVTLRNLSINGAGSGLTGIRILAARAVFVEDCEIFGFKGGSTNELGRAISDRRSAGGALYVTGTTLRDNAQSGIVLAPSSGSTRISAVVDNCWIQGNGVAGIVVINGCLATVSRTIITGNAQAGIIMEESAGSTEANVDGCTIAHNPIGILMQNGTPTLRLSNSSVVNNTVGLNLTGGTVASYVNNRIEGNGSGNAPSPGANIPLR